MGTTVVTYAWGDMMTDMIQPFCAIAMLAVEKLNFRTSWVGCSWSSLSISLSLLPRFFSSSPTGNKMGLSLSQGQAHLPYLQSYPFISNNSRWRVTLQYQLRGIPERGSALTHPYHKLPLCLHF
jgi:hypothetical protein